MKKVLGVSKPLDGFIGGDHVDHKIRVDVLVVERPELYEIWVASNVPQIEVGRRRHYVITVEPGGRLAWLGQTRLEQSCVQEVCLALLVEAKHKHVFGVVEKVYFFDRCSHR